MKRVLFLIAIFCAFKANAQNYLISFAGIGTSTTVSTVKVENLNKGTSLTLNGGDILRLNITTGVHSIEREQSFALKIYPNPMTDNSSLSIFPPVSGNATISIYDMIGRMVAQTESYLENSLQIFSLSGLKNGFYFINVKGNNYQFSGKLLSNGKSNGKISIAKINNIVQPVDNKVEKIDSKGTQATIDMAYTTGDRLKFVGTSGNYSTVKIDIPASNKTITFNFIACTDGDNNNYPVVEIGTQVWMEENLKTTKYNDNTTIPLVTDNSIWYYLTTPGYCWYNNDEASFKSIYGAMYNWYTVNTGKLCPQGWHVPNNAEWTTLKVFLGNDPWVGLKMKETGSLHWQGINTGVTNESGFTALPGGYRSSLFAALGTAGYYRSITESTQTQAEVWYMLSGNTSITNSIGGKLTGYSVRCLKDQPKIPEAFPGTEGIFKKVVIGSDTINCKLVDTTYIFQGDIILTKDQLINVKGTAIPSLSKRWTNGVIYYSINSNLPQKTRDDIILAIDDYEFKTNLKFVERTTEQNYVEFVNSETLAGIFVGSCSRLGMIGGKQKIWLEPSWNKLPEIIHEIGHTLGLLHESTRPDRDIYINVIYSNIKKSLWDQYDIFMGSLTTNEFDFKSIMLYPSFNGSAIDTQSPTIEINPGYYTDLKYIIYNTKLSSGDIEMINNLYGGIAPSASFTASKTTISRGESIQFTDQSSNNPNQWYWDFGDGNTSSLQNPTHIYEKVGLFKVTLKVVNNYDFDIETKTNYINVNEAGSTVTDIDGNIYSTVAIGIQVWMAQNLRTTKYNDGTPIPNEIDNNLWMALTTGAYCWYNNDIVNYKETYGAMYNWFVVDNASNGSKNVCPIGWHVPTDVEWTILTDYLTNNNYGYGGIGGKIGKAFAATWGWTLDSTPGNIGNDQASNNSSGFTALPAGVRQGAFISIGNRGGWWSSTDHIPEDGGAWGRTSFYNNSIVDVMDVDKRYAYSVRCLKDY